MLSTLKKKSLMIVISRLEGDHYDQTNLLEFLKSQKIEMQLVRHGPAINAYFE
jgi:hypothetical protein